MQLQLSVCRNYQAASQSSMAELVHRLFNNRMKAAKLGALCIDTKA